MNLFRLLEPCLTPRKFNSDNREVHKWEDRYSQVIEHFKSILSREMVDFIGRNFQPDRINRLGASIQHIFQMIGGW